MSHIAVLKIDISHPEHLSDDKFIKAFLNVLKQLFNADFHMEQYGYLMYFRGKGEKGIMVFSLDLSKGLTIRVDEDFFSRFGVKNKEEFQRKIKQGIILSTQLSRYKKYKVRAVGNKLEAVVLA